MSPPTVLVRERGIVARVFVSHASADADPAARLRQWLVDDGHEVFLDRDIDDGIALGDEWEQRLHERLRWADAVVCVVTSAYLASVWCTAEAAIARSRGGRLLPVVAEPDVRHPLLASLQQVDLTKDAAAAQRTLAEALGRIDAAGGSGWPDGCSPFPGLRPFDVELRRVFFGRSGEVEQLLEQLRSPAERVDGAVLLVVGPSGCGKSSLVRAGLLPAVAEEPGWWTLPVLVPGADPVGALARELAEAGHAAGLRWTPTQVRERLGDVGLAGLANDVLLATRRRHLLVVVDQFEELLTQTPPDQKAQFAALLRPGAAGPVQVVATVRPEFIDRLLADVDLGALSGRRPFLLQPLRREALRTVVVAPARLAGIRIGPDLVARLVDDTDSGDALPLLAFALSQLGKGVGRGGELSAARYDELGGVRGALARQADVALAEAIVAGGRDRDHVIAALLRLVTVDEHGAPTRHRVDRADLPAPIVAELDAFVAQRLLTTDTDGDKKVVIGVAHEAFLSAWPPLKDAIDRDVTGLRARRAVENAADSWDRNQRSPVRLWEGGQLQAALADTGARLRADGARPWSKRVVVTDRIELTAPARAFVHASIQRDRYRRRRATTVLSVLLVLALTAAGFAFVQQRAARQQQYAAEEQQRAATARELVTQADAARSGDPRTALLLGIAAERIHPDAQTGASLVETLTASRYVGTLSGNSLGVQSLAFSSDGRTVVAGTSAGAVLWDVTAPGRATLLGPTLISGRHPGAYSETVENVAFSSDKRTLALGTVGGTYLWNVADPSRPRLQGGPIDEGIPNAIAFSPNGRMLAVYHDRKVIDRESTVELYDVSDPTRPRRLGRAPAPAGASDAAKAAFSSDGRMLAVVDGPDVHVTTWDVTDPVHPRRTRSAQTKANSGYVLAIAPDLRTMAIGGGFSGDLSLWDLTAAPRPYGKPVSGHRSIVQFGAFSPDGHTLATATQNGDVIVWDVTNPYDPQRLGEPLTGHGDRLVSLAFSPDGHTIATGDVGGTVLLWDLAAPAPPTRIGKRLLSRGEPETGDESTSSAPELRFLAASTDGRLLATGSTEGTVTLWDLADPKRPHRLTSLATGPGMVGLTFVSGGHRLATIRRENGYEPAAARTTLWDLTDPAAPHRLGTPTAGTTISADGRFLAGLSKRPDPIHGSAYSIVQWDLTDPAHPRRRGRPLDVESSTDAETVAAMALSPDGRILVTGMRDDSLVIWDLRDPDHVRRLGNPLPGYSQTVIPLVFSPDGRTLAVRAGDGRVNLWNFTDPARPSRIGQPLSGSGGDASSMAFSPDGRTLAVNHNFPHETILWDLSDPAQPRRLGQPMTEPFGSGFPVTFLAGRNILAAAVFGDTILWDLAGLQNLRSKAVEHACARTGRGLDRTEWARYIPGLPYRDTCAA